MGFMHGRRIAHCPYCGHAYTDRTVAPERLLTRMAVQRPAHPLPAAVALQPVTEEDRTRALAVALAGRLLLTP